MDKVMVIGIAGGTGSGKTTITRRIMQRFGSDVSVIYHDNYYKAHHNMPFDDRGGARAQEGAQRGLPGLRLLGT